MKIVEDFSQGKMNKDADARYMEKGQYRHLLNGRVIDGDSENSGVIEGVSGTEAILSEPLLFDEYGMVSGKIIGIKAIEDDIFCIGYRNGSGTFIVRYDTLTRSRQVVLTDFGEEKLFPFDENTVISAIHKYDDLLIFHDKNVHAPFKVNLKRVSGDDVYYGRSEEAMLVKRQPDMPEVLMGNDDSLSGSSFRNNVFWFACRYVYEDGEVSAISPYSAPQVTTRNKEEKDDTDVLGLALIANKEGRKTLQAGTYEPAENKLSLAEYSGSVESDYVNGMVYIKKENAMYISMPDKVLLYDGTEFSEIANKEDFMDGSLAFGGVGSDVLNSVVLLTAGYSKAGNKDIFIYKYDKQSNVWGLVFNKSYGDESIKIEAAYCDVMVSSFGRYAFARTGHKFFRNDSFGNKDKWAETFSLKGNLVVDGSAVITDMCCSADGRIVYLCAHLRHGEVSSTFSLLVYRSMDYGKNFDKIGVGIPVKSSSGGSMGCSSDGRIVYVSGHVSKDYGETFESCFDYDDSDGINIPVAGNVHLSRHSKQTAVSWSGKHVAMGVVNSSGPSNTMNLVITSDEYGGKGTFDLLRETLSQGLGISSGVIQYGIPPGGIDDLYFINDVSNFADIRYFTGNKHVKAVDILMKSGSTMYRIVRIRKDEQGIPDDTFRTYRFTNTMMYTVVPSKDVAKLFDNVPLSAGTSTIVQNALMFGNYVEGFDTDEINSRIEVDVEHSEFVRGAISLKTGTKQRYGIVYYDYFGRCTPVLRSVDVEVEKFTKYRNEERRTARIKVYGDAPSWAVKYKIARGTPNISFDFVQGFTSVYAVDGKLYLEITGFPWITPKAGDYLELIGDSMGEDVPNLVIPVFDYLDSSGDGTDVSITLSDGTHVSSTSNKRVSPVPAGRFIVINPPDLEGFGFADVVANRDLYDSSNFYVVYEDSTVNDVLFNEVPYEFEVVNGLHSGNVKNQEDDSDYAECLLDMDGDVVLLDSPTRELNRYPNRSVFTTLGRTIGKVENYSRVHRFAGLCVSEPYVDDTKYNGLASFNASLLNYKDLEKNHREIELIDGFDTNVEVYQRDKVSVVQYRKNVLNTASGEKMVAQSQDIFGEQQMSSADYGMDDFRSYAKSGNARYFVDGSRGVVLRKGENGIIPISRYGMDGYFFDELTKNGCLGGVYDARHNSYLLCLKEGAVNFLESNNGWSSFFNIVPDVVCSTNSGVFSFKDGVLYRHDVKGSDKLYDRNQEVVVRFLCNDYPEVVKVFDAIMVESSSVPMKVVLRTGEGVSEIVASDFEQREKLYLAYAPMCRGVGGAEYVMAGVCANEYRGFRIPLLNQNFTAIHKGDAVYRMDSSGGWMTEIGVIESIGSGFIETDNIAELNGGEYIVCADLSQINGSMHRGRYMEVEMHFTLYSGLLVRSVQVDIDESKV